MALLLRCFTYECTSIGLVVIKHLCDYYRTGFCCMTMTDKLHMLAITCICVVTISGKVDKFK